MKNKRIFIAKEVKMANKKFWFGMFAILLAFVFVVGTVYAQTGTVLQTGLYKNVRPDTADVYYSIEAGTRSNTRRVQLISANGRHIAWGTAVFENNRATVSFDNVSNEVWTIVGQRSFRNSRSAFVFEKTN